MTELKFDIDTLQKLANDQVISDREPWVSDGMEAFVQALAKKLESALMCNCIVRLEPFPYCAFYQLLLDRTEPALVAPVGDRQKVGYLRLLISRLGPFYEALQVRGGPTGTWVESVESEIFPTFQVKQLFAEAMPILCSEGLTHLPTSLLAQPLPREVHLPYSMHSSPYTVRDAFFWEED